MVKNGWLCFFSSKAVLNRITRKVDKMLKSKLLKNTYIISKAKKFKKYQHKFIKSRCINYIAPFTISMIPHSITDTDQQTKKPEIHIFQSRLP